MRPTLSEATAARDQSINGQSVNGECTQIFHVIIRNVCDGSRGTAQQAMPDEHACPGFAERGVTQGCSCAKDSFCASGQRTTPPMQHPGWAVTASSHQQHLLVGAVCSY